MEATPEQVDEMIAAFNAIGTWLKYLGNGDCGDPRGAIEFLSGCVKDGLSEVARSLDGLADAIRDSKPR